MRRVVSNCLATVAFVLVILAFGQPSGSSAQGSSLSLGQIQKLIEIHAPDGVVAQEIRSRGLGFLPTPKTLDQLQKNGAGPTTLAALKERMPVGTLEIQGPAGSQVTMDGIDQGVTDAQGRLVLAGIPAGQHRLSVQKSGYHSGEFDLTLAAKEYKRFPVQLDWAGGFLTVHSDPPGALIEVAGIGRYKDGVSDLPCPPGRYDITASRTGMKSKTQSVVVAAGQHAAVEVRLAADPEYLRNGLADASQRLARGDVQGAIQACNSLLSLKPNDPATESLLAAAYLRARNLQQFQDAATSAIRSGGSVALDLEHEHLELLSGEAIHPAVLTITAKSIAYDPRDSPCKYRGFVAPLGNIDAIEVTNKNQSGFVVVRHLTPGTFLLHLELRDPAKRNSKISLDFATQDSRIERQYNIGFLASPGDSSQILTAVANVIRSDAEGGRK